MKFFSRTDITDCEGRPYLTRWHLFRFGEQAALMLHRFHCSDEDRALHDHPWPFITLILRGGYIEYAERTTLCRDCNDRFFGFLPKGLRPLPCYCGGKGFFTYVEQKRKWPGMLLYRPATWRHRVELIEGRSCWTLVLRLKRFREWGFWTKEGFVHWQKWWRSNCE